ncbi:glycoside hydrolase family 2 protein [Paenibacillus mendelii]|uniref:beta-mannosidase n=1 Tax=Paenibacillus mendelii TaxID=206163 RepID=A0ABV6J2Z9_9BACL|nr:glycoside hydrolase family 2 TIM barrel-domain containing protein [Paenibacillus mendelii]MCQ6559363.1 hypothetical protein [Paenibacillus mendelii]
MEKGREAYLELNEKWELSGFYPGFWAFGKSMELGLELKGVVPWIPASVPGSIHWDLHRAGYLPDPYFGANAAACEWVNARDWMYRTSFQADPSWAGKRIRLVLEGVDHSARVLLNGKECGGHTGMFKPGLIELPQDSLRLGESNTLAIVLERSPEGVAQLGRTDEVDHLKSRFGYKWDFCPRLVHIGLWKKVGLKISDWCSLDHVGYEAVPTADGAGLLKVNAVVESINSGLVRLEAELYDPDGKPVGSELYEGTVNPGLQTIRLHLPVEAVRLWWPNGYGDQPLYRVVVKLHHPDSTSNISDKDTASVGFRMLSFHANPGAPADALAYTVAVNGKAIYMKGWNWVPADQLYGRDTADKLRRLISLAKQANVNLLRIWGGGLIETELFYSLCDQAGILIWQEMMQSSSGFNNEPSAAPAFLHTLYDTMRHVIRERSSHPSLAIWCGGNELTEGGHLDSRMKPLTDRHPNMQLLRNLVSDLDDTRYFLPTSPSGPTFFLSAEDAGKGIMYDVHGPWKHSGEEGHYKLYNASDALLHSEYGGDGFASPESLRRFLPPERLSPEQSGSIEWQQHGYEYWNMDDQLQSLFGGPFDTLARMSEAAQWLQAEGIRYAVEANRRRAPHCSGSLLWQFNEPYPNVSCTSSVDYYGDPKLAYSWVARANRNRHILLRYEAVAYLPGEDFTGSVFLTRDGEGADGSIQVEWIALDASGRGLAAGDFTVGEAPEAEAVLAGEMVFKVPAADVFVVRLKARDAKNCQLVADNEYTFAVKADEKAPPLEAFRSLAATALRWETAVENGGTRVTVTNTGDTAALFVRVRGLEVEAEADGASQTTPSRPLNDGFVVLPGETDSCHVEGVLPEERRWLVTYLNG